jgi:hypothetical protein
MRLYTDPATIPVIGSNSIGKEFLRDGCGWIAEQCDGSHDQRTGLAPVCKSTRKELQNDVLGGSSDTATNNSVSDLAGRVLS